MRPIDAERTSEKIPRLVFNNDLRARQWAEEWEKTRKEILELLKGRKTL